MQPPENDPLMVKVAERLRNLEDAIESSNVDKVQPYTSFVGKTVTVSSYPVTANVFYGVQPQTVTGTEIEGYGGSLSPYSTTIYAYNLGSQIPPVGTSILVAFAEMRWVFTYG